MSRKYYPSGMRRINHLVYGLAIRPKPAPNLLYKASLMT
jgi:hypothetical protein